MDDKRDNDFQWDATSTLKLIISNMPGYVYWKDIHSRYMGCNNNFAAVSHLKSPDDIVGKVDADFSWGVELAEQFRKDDEYVLQSKTTHSSVYSLPLKNKDGNTIVVRTEKKPLYNEQGQLMGLLAIATDITEHELLREKSDTLHALTEEVIYHLPGLIYWKNKNSQYMGFNKNVVQLSGLTREELLGKTDFELNWGIEEAASFRKDDEEIMRTGIVKITEHQIPIKRSDGRNIVVRTEKTRLYNKNGDIAGVMAVAIDITDQKILEAKLIREKTHNFKSIIQNLPGYIYWKDLYSRYMGCNQNLATVSNLNSPDDIVGKTDADFEWGIELAEKFTQDDQFVLDSQTVQTSVYSLPIKNKEGNNIVVRTDKRPLYNEQNQLAGLLAVSMDITEEELLRKNLQHEKERVEILYEAKNNFIRNMEHDLRTPFSGVYSLIKQMAENETNNANKNLLSIIALSSKELLDYCNIILEFARMEAQIFPVLSEKIDLKSIIDSVCNMELAAAKAKNLTFTWSYDELLPRMFLGDKHRLQRILINLISNAIKFTPDGFVNVSAVLVKNVDKDHCLVRFIIKDSGIGIHESQRMLIFEKFTRLNPSNQGKYKGLGLGLAAVKFFVDELEGEVDVDIQTGKGTTFFCTFLMKRPLSEDLFFGNSKNG